MTEQRMRTMEETADNHHEVLARLHVYLKQFDNPQFKRFASDNLSRQSTEAEETAMAVDGEEPGGSEKRQRHHILQESTNAQNNGQENQVALATTALPQRNE